MLLASSYSCYVPNRVYDLCVSLQNAVCFNSLGARNQDILIEVADSYERDEYFVFWNIDDVPDLLFLLHAHGGVQQARAELHLGQSKKQGHHEQSPINEWLIAFWS